MDVTCRKINAHERRWNRCIFYSHEKVEEIRPLHVGCTGQVADYTDLRKDKMPRSSKFSDRAKIQT